MKMKDVISKSGEIEKQPREYAPDGPVRLAPNAPDSRGRLNGDGSKSKILAERPVYVSDDAWRCEPCKVNMANHRSECLICGATRPGIARDRYREALKEIAAIEPCPCPCCGDHEAVTIARRALEATVPATTTPDGKGFPYG